MRQVTHALLTRPPLSHNALHPERIKAECFARLACVKHAASVHPEPGSNSHVKVLIPVKIRLANFNRYYCCFGSSQNLHFAHRVQLAHACKQSWTRFYRECSECSLELQGLTKSLCSQNFQGFTYCSVFKELCFVVAFILSVNSFILSYRFRFVKYFFHLFDSVPGSSG